MNSIIQRSTTAWLVNVFNWVSNEITKLIGNWTDYLQEMKMLTFWYLLHKTRRVKVVSVLVLCLKVVNGKRVRPKNRSHRNTFGRGNANRLPVKPAACLCYCHQGFRSAADQHSAGRKHKESKEDASYQLKFAHFKCFSSTVYLSLRCSIYARCT